MLKCSYYDVMTEAADSHARAALTNKSTHAAMALFPNILGPSIFRRIVSGMLYPPTKLYYSRTWRNEFCRWPDGQAWPRNGNTTVSQSRSRNMFFTRAINSRLEMCMGMGFPMGPGIPWESHGNGNKTQNWKWEWEGMGNHLSGNGNYLHSHGNYSQRCFMLRWAY